MKILLASNSFTTKESIGNIFKNIFESVSVVQTSNLKDCTIIDLINYDFIFMEFDENSYDDIDLIVNVKSISSYLKVILLDRRKCKKTFTKALNNSIDGYITDLSDKEDFIHTVKKVFKGKKVYEAELIHSIASKNEMEDIDALTKREREVLDEIAKGLNNRSIASSLYITEYTVKKHVSNILSKLNLNSRQEAIIYVNQLS